MALNNTGINADFSADVTTRAAYNQEASAAIPHGSVVAAGTGATDSSRHLKAAKNITGCVLPTYANYLIRGIAKAHDGVSIAAGGGFEVITAGIAVARVRVPQSTNLAVGTELVPATAWDSTNHRALFATSSAGANAASLEPVIISGNIVSPANPLARLVEPLTASASADTIQLAYVEVLPNRMVPFNGSLDITGANTTDKTPCLFVPMGPAIITGLFAQMSNDGSAGSVAINAKNSPLLSTPDQVNVLSTAITIANDGVDLTIGGLTAGLAGDVDAAVSGLGTGGSQGVIAAAANRVMISRSMLEALLDYSSGTAQADMRVLFSGKYL